MKSVYFIDSHASQYQEILSGLTTDSCKVVLQPDSNGLAQIADFLVHNKINNLKAIHIFGEGAPGQLILGNDTLTTNGLHKHSSLLATIGNALGADSNILLYACELAQGSSGSRFVDTLAHFTRATVAASSKRVGCAALGGQWALDVLTGMLTVQPVKIDQYQGVLSATTTISLQDTSSYTTFGNTTGSFNLANSGIEGGSSGSWLISGATYNDMKADHYGTLYENTGTGAYVYVPNNPAINTLGTLTNVESFNILSTTGDTVDTLRVALTGTWETPVVTAPSTMTFTDAATYTQFSNQSNVLNATDINGSGITYSIANAGTLITPCYAISVCAYGTLSVNLLTGSYIFTPNNAAINALTTSVTEAFTLTATANGLTASTTLNVLINGTLEAPVIAAPAAMTFRDAATYTSFANQTGIITATDVDAGTLSYGISSSSHVTATINSINYDQDKTGNYGTLYVNSSTGQYVYVPNNAAINALTTTAADSFTLTSTANGVTGSNTLNVSLIGANVAPAINSLTHITFADTSTYTTFSSQTGNISAANPGTSALTYGVSGGSATSYTSGGITYNQTDAGQYGTLYLNTSNGKYIYVPNNASINALTSNTTDQFTLTAAANGQTGSNTLTVNLNGTYETPVVSAPTAITFTDSSTYTTFSNQTGSLSASDIDGLSMSYSINGAHSASYSSGGISYNSSDTGSYGTLYINTSTGQYVYVPNSTQINAVTSSASETFTLAASTHGLTGSGTLTIDVAGYSSNTPVVNPPTTITYTDTSSYTTFTSQTGSISAKDTPPSPMTYGVTGETSTNVILGGITYNVQDTGSYGTLYLNTSSGQYVYVPNSGAINALTTSTTEHYTLTAAANGHTGSSTLNINLQGTYEAPVVSTPTAVTYTDTSTYTTFSNQTGAITASDIDTSSLTYAVSGGTTIGSTVIGSGTYNTQDVGSYGTLYLNSSNGQYVYVPNNRAINSLTSSASDNFTLKVSALGGTTTSSTLSVNVNGHTETPVVSTPTALTYTDAATYTTFTQQAGTIATNIDSSSMSYAVSGGTSAAYITGGITYNNSDVGSYGTLYINSTSGAYVYVPNSAAINAITANTSDSFSLSAATSGLTGSSTLVVDLLAHITTTPVITAPTALTYTDTTTYTTFSNQTGTVSASDAVPGSLTYGISGSSAASYSYNTVTYNTSEAGSYGTLYINSTSGAYVYVPNSAAINALNSAQTSTDNFVLTVANGATSSSTLTVNLDGHTELPALTALATVNSNVASTTDVTLNMSASYTHIDADTYTASESTVNHASGGGLTLNSVSTNSVSFSYALSLPAQSGSVTTTYDSFAVTVSDTTFSSATSSQTYAFYLLNGTSGNDTLTNSSYAYAILNGGNGNDTYNANYGYNVLVGGSGTDTFSVANAATAYIVDLGNNKDVLNVSSGGSAVATLTTAWTPTASTSNSGSATLMANGHNVNLTSVTGSSGWTIIDNVGNTSIQGSTFGDTLSGVNGDTLTAGSGSTNPNEFIAAAGTVTITSMSLTSNTANDKLIVGGDASVTAIVSSIGNWTPTTGITNNGTISLAPITSAAISLQNITTGTGTWIFNLNSDDNYALAGSAGTYVFENKFNGPNTLIGGGTNTTNIFDIVNDNNTNLSITMNGSATNIIQNPDTSGLFTVTVVSAGWTATNSVSTYTASNKGTLTIAANALNINMAAITGSTHGITIKDTASGTGNVTLTAETSPVSDTLIGANGDTLVGTTGTGNDVFNVTGSETILNLGNSDILVASAGSSVTASIYSTGWTAGSGTSNSGSVTLVLGASSSHEGVNLNVNVGTKGYTVTDNGSSDTIVGSNKGDIITAGINDALTLGNGVNTVYAYGGDTITGSTTIVTNALYIESGTVNMSNVVSGDEFAVSAGATLVATLAGSYTAVAASGSSMASLVNNGSATFVLNGHSLNLSTTGNYNGVNVTDTADAVNVTVTGTSVGNDTINLSLDTGNDTISIGTGNDSITLGTGTSIINSGSGNDTIVAGNTGNDTITLGIGNDSVTLGGGFSTVTVQSTGNDTLNVQTTVGVGTSGLEKINGWNTHDQIGDISGTLVIGGSTAAATSTIASINATTGDASFASTPSSLASAITQVINSFNAGTNSAGAFAIFEYSSNEYVLVSDGTAGGTHDNVIELVGVTAIQSAHLTGGLLAIH